MSFLLGRELRIDDGAIVQGRTTPGDGFDIPGRAVKLDRGPRVNQRAASLIGQIDEMETGERESA